jgi:hypothetical protein
MAWTAIAAMTPREKEPTDTNPDRKCSRERLPRYDIAITNREAGDEGEIQCVPDRPVLDKANQQAQGNLNSQNCRQHGPRQMDGAAEGHEKAPPHALWCQRGRCGAFVFLTRHHSGSATMRLRLASAAEWSATHCGSYLWGEAIRQGWKVDLSVTAADGGQATFSAKC